MLATTHSQPSTAGTFARPVVSMVLTEPPPPDPSTRRISGSRRSCAIRSHVLCLPLMVASADPPRTVKSSPPTTTDRPSTLARPNRKLERSEEHTSELQSRGHLVCRLLLEKKNNKSYVSYIITS